MEQWLLLPVLVHVALVFFLGLRLGGGRRAAALKGEVKLTEVALDNDGWPQRLRQVGNAYNNQFQLPVAFYSCIAFPMLFAKTDPVAILFSWLFVAARYVHAWIHVTSNFVPYRFYAFGVGVMCLLVLWIHLAARVYVTG
jgi:hypothetical protein